MSPARSSAATPAAAFRLRDGLMKTPCCPAWNQIEITKRLTGRRVGADGSREERKKPTLAYTSSRSAGQPVSRRLLGPHTLPPLHLLAQASSLCAPLQPPGKTAAQAPPPRGSQPRAPHRVAAAARRASDLRRSRRSHISRTRCRRAAHTAAFARRGCLQPAPRQRHRKQNHGRHIEALGRGPTFC